MSVRRGTGGRRWLMLAGLVGLALWAYRSPVVVQWLSRDHLHAMVGGSGAWGPVAFAAIKVVSIVLGIPTTPVTMAGGALFGAVWGSLLNWAAATAGAVLCFAVGRHLGRDGVQRLLRGRLARWDDGLAGDGFWFVLMLRLVPLFPFNVINYAAGLTAVSFRDYTLATALGIIPGTVAFTVLGDAAVQASPLRMGIALGLLGLLALLPVVVRRRRRRSLGRDH